MTMDAKINEGGALTSVGQAMRGGRSWCSVASVMALAMVLIPLAGCSAIGGLFSSSEDGDADSGQPDSAQVSAEGTASTDPSDQADAKALAKADRPSHPLAFTMTSLEGEPVDMSRYEGKVVLIVNTASHCGLTPQYKGLQKLHKKYRDQGLAVLGFPANNFGNQEPGSDQQIAQFCEQNYGVEFDMFSKISVKGSDQHPMYSLLTSGMGQDHLSGPVRWNFEKFLIDRQGNLVARFAPTVSPTDSKVTKAIERALTPTM